jgi:uncharacterized protein YxjI
MQHQPSGHRAVKSARPRAPRAATSYQVPVPRLPWGGELVVLDRSYQPAFRVTRADSTGDEALSHVDVTGRERCTIHGTARALQPAMRLTRADQPLAQVRKVVIAPLSERYEIDVGGGDRLHVKGAVTAFEYAIHRGRRVVALVSSARVGRTEHYGVQIAPNVDTTMLLAVTICICLMSGSV